MHQVNYIHKKESQIDMHNTCQITIYYIVSYRAIMKITYKHDTYMPKKKYGP